MKSEDNNKRTSIFRLKLHLQQKMSKMVNGEKKENPWNWMKKKPMKVKNVGY